MAHDNQSEWTTCMKQRHRADPQLTVDELRWECEYDRIFLKAQRDADNHINMGTVLITLGVASLIYTHLQGGQKPRPGVPLPSQPVAGRIGIAGPLGEMNLPSDVLRISTYIRFPPDFILPSNLKLDQYKYLYEQLRHHGRLEDPRTIENIQFKWQQNISDKVGSFGDLEANKQGELDLYKGETVVIPWWTQQDDHVCPVCRKQEIEGPYPPDGYPEPPHFACRCNDPFPEPIRVYPGRYTMIEI